MSRIQYDDKGQIIRELSVEEAVKRKTAQEYLTRLEEVRRWMNKIDSDILRDENQTTVEFEESLRNGIPFAKLASKLAPEEFPARMIYDAEYQRFQSRGLEFRHSDNINILYRFFEHVQLPQIFYPITTDIYDKKNMPKGIYSIYALAVLLYKKGIVKFKIESLEGKVDFDQDQINKIQNEFDKLGISMPQFGKINGIIADKVSVGDAERLAAIIKINEAIESQSTEQLGDTLNHPNAEMKDIDSDSIEAYLTVLTFVRNRKIEDNKSIIESTSHDDLDYFTKNLTQKEIQKNISDTNFKHLLKEIDIAIVDQKTQGLVRLLNNESLDIKDTLVDAHASYYLKSLTEARDHQKEFFTGTGDYYLDKKMIQDAISKAIAEADRDIKLSNCINAINSAIRSNDQAQFDQEINSPVLKLENFNQERSQEYLTHLNGLYEKDNERFFEAKDLQSAINDVNGEADTQKKIAEVLVNLKDSARDGDIEAFTKNINSKLLDLGDLNPHNMHLYMEKLKEDPSAADSVESLKALVAECDAIYDEAQQLALATIGLSENSESVRHLEGYLDMECTGLKNINRDYLEHYSRDITSSISEIRQKELSKEEKSRRNLDTGFFGGKMKSGRQFFYDESQNVIYWAQEHMSTPKLEDLTRLSLAKLQGIMDHTNDFQSIVQHRDGIGQLQDVIRTLMASKTFRERYAHLQVHQKDIETIQTFLKGFLRRGDWSELMSGDQVKFSTAAKFVSILMPTGQDLDMILSHKKLKQEVNDLIMEYKKNSDTVHALDVSLGLLVQSNYSERPKGKKADPNAKIFTQMRHERMETLAQYGAIIYHLHSNVKYLSTLINAVDDQSGTSLENTVLSIFNYISTEKEEGRALNCCCKAIKQLAKDSRGISLLTDENPQVIRCLILAMRHIQDDQMAVFTKVFQPIVDEIISLPNLDITLDPLACFLKVVKGQPPMNLTVEDALKNSDVSKAIEANVKVYIEYVGKIIDAFCTHYDYVPFFIRSAIQYILKMKTLDKKEKRNIIGNIIFNRFFSPMITSPDSFEMTSKKSESIKEKHRKFLSDVSKIVYAVSIGRGFTEEYLEALNDAIGEWHEKVISSYTKIADIPNPEDHYQMSKRSDFAIDTDTVTIRIEEVLMLHRLLLENEDKLSLGPEDPLIECLSTFRNPSIENFLRDTSIDQVQKAETANKLVTIELVPTAKKAKTSEMTMKSKLKLAKLLVCQALFAVDRNVFMPSTITELLQHEWTDVERGLHAKNVEIIKKIEELNISMDKSGKSRYLMEDLEGIRKQTVEFLDELVQAKMLSKEDDYQLIVDKIAADIRNEHARKLETQRERTALAKTHTGLLEKNKHIKEKITFLEQYISSLKKNISSGKNNKRKSIFSRSSKSAGPKPKEYSADALLKNNVIEPPDSQYDNQRKGLHVKIVPQPEGIYEMQLNVLGKKVEQQNLSMEELLLDIYKSKSQKTIFQGITFNSEPLYKLLKEM